ncbi:MAG: right-handed parallel beta-helix repeat-containing protein [Lachnospiraceae bacterium]|nr:right-handed parallel beta-helix repeat-containing protein [Lachnospiraceae bacterium]
MNKKPFCSILSLLLSLLLVIESAAPLLAEESGKFYPDTAKESLIGITKAGEGDSYDAKGKKNLRLYADDAEGDGEETDKSAPLDGGTEDAGDGSHESTPYDDGTESAADGSLDPAPYDDGTESANDGDDWSIPSDERTESIGEKGNESDVSMEDSDERSASGAEEAETNGKDSLTDESLASDAGLTIDESSAFPDDSSLSADAVLTDIIEETPAAEDAIGASNYIRYTVTDKAFGANGNDKASDTSSINKALYEAKKTVDSRKEMVEVYVPAGTYYLNDVLLIYSTTWLHLDPAATFVRTDLNHEMISGAHRDGNNVCYSKNCKHYGYTQVTNVKISGGRWNGGVSSDKCSGSNYGRNLFTFCHCRNIVISDTRIGDDCSIHSVSFEGAQNVTVSNVTFQNHYRYTGNNAGYYVGKSPSNYQDYWVKEALHFDDIYPNAPSGSYPIEKLASMNLDIENCTFRNVVAGLGTHNSHGDNPTMNVKIRRNTFDTVYYYCMNIFYYKDFDVMYNKASNVSGFFYGMDCGVKNKPYNYIQYNEVRCRPFSGYPIQETIHVFGKTKIFIDGNKFWDIPSRCIFLKDLVSNKTDTAYSEAIVNLNQMEYGAGMAMGNNHYAAIFVGKGWYADLWKNTILLKAHTKSDYEITGIHLNYSAKGCKAKWNTIEGGDVGIYVRESNSAYLYCNQARKTKKFGVYCIRSGQLEVKGNLFLDNLQHGFMFDCCNGARITRNTSVRNASRDLWINQSSSLQGLDTFNARVFLSSDRNQACRKYVECDINYDGKLTILDVQTLRQYVSNSKDLLRSELFMGDLDKDGKLTNNDVNLMLRRLVN